MSNINLISIERIKRTIYLIRGEKVMLDRDLAELYQVQTKALNQAVRRNLDRFPADFMFQLSEKEVAELNRSQFVTGSEKHRDPRFRPYAFHRTRCRHALECVTKQAGDNRQHRDHACVCKAAANARVQCRTLSSFG